MDVYPQSTVRDALLGQDDGRTLLRTPSQINALLGLSDDEIRRARQRILVAIAQSHGAEVPSERMVDVKPTIVQIAAHDPDVAVKAATMILEMSGSAHGGAAPVAAIDLNLGEARSATERRRPQIVRDSFVRTSPFTSEQGVRRGERSRRIEARIAHRPRSAASRSFPPQNPSAASPEKAATARSFTTTFRS